MKPTLWAALSALELMLVVLMGSFGAHALKDRLSESSLQLWQTASHYLGVVALATLGFAALCQLLSASTRAFVPLQAGALIFSASLILLSLGAPRWIGAITPIGGMLMIIGFAWFALFFVKYA